jgi:glycosyltransferase involved in cell wall biosynthesis
MKVVHLITDLHTGGAEMMLLKVLSAMDRRRFPSVVVSLLEPGPVAPRIRDLGIAVHTLGMSRGRPSARGLLRLRRLLADERPAVLQTWMYHANLLGEIARWASPVRHTVWNIRAAALNLSAGSRMTAWTVRAGAMLSRSPSAVVVNSDDGQSGHAALGYRPRRWEVIPNGFDLNRFTPDASARLSLRQELSLPADALLIGLAGRYDPQKDHPTFFRAAALLAKRHPRVHFVLAGPGIVPGNDALTRLIEGPAAPESFHLLGERADMPRIMAALDVFSSSSAYGEGFPNVVGEAMACGTPCVATDVGDSAAVVGDTGGVVPPRDPAALAEGWDRLLDAGADGRRRLGEAARQRVRDNYSLERVAGLYEALYSSLGGN